MFNKDQLEAQLKANAKSAIFERDFANAFNTIPRKYILGQLYKHPELASMYPLIHWADIKPVI